MAEKTSTVQFMGKTIEVSWEPIDFSKLVSNEKLVKFGVYIEDNKIYISDKTSFLYQQYSALHEMLCPASGIMCQEIEGVCSCCDIENLVLNEVIMSGVERTEICDFITNRAQMYEGLMEYYANDKEKCKSFSASHCILVRALARL